MSRFRCVRSDIPDGAPAKCFPHCATRIDSWWRQARIASRRMMRTMDTAAPLASLSLAALLALAGCGGGGADRPDPPIPTCIPTHLGRLSPTGRVRSCRGSPRRDLSRDAELQEPVGARRDSRAQGLRKSRDAGGRGHGARFRCDHRLHRLGHRSGSPDVRGKLDIRRIPCRARRTRRSPGLPPAASPTVPPSPASPPADRSAPLMRRRA